MVGVQVPDWFLVSDVVAFTGGLGVGYLWSTQSGAFNETQHSTGLGLRVSLRARQRLDEAWLVSGAAFTELNANTPYGWFAEKGFASGVLVGAALSLEYDPLVRRPR